MPGERVIVRQNRALETEFLAHDAQESETAEARPVAYLEDLTPYGMLLASLGGCTGLVLHTYAQHHGLALERVELRLRYDRVFAKDCADCEKTEDYHDTVDLEILLEGSLRPEDQQHLLLVSQHCPIHRMLARGIPVASRLVEGLEAGRG
jgi:putative redox protein